MPSDAYTRVGKPTPGPTSGTFNYGVFDSATFDQPDDYTRIPKPSFPSGYPALADYAVADQSVADAGDGYTRAAKPTGSAYTAIAKPTT